MASKATAVLRNYHKYNYDSEHNKGNFYVNSIMLYNGRQVYAVDNDSESWNNKHFSIYVSVIAAKK